MEDSVISVIVPVYNVEKYLNKCVESIINQTYKNLEIILVDDGSPDRCPEICDEYAKKDKRIKVIHKQNEGVSSARNIGIEKSKGNFIAFVDSDDFLEFTMYENLLNKQKEKDYDVVLCKYNVIYEGKKKYLRDETELSKFCLTKDIGFLLNSPIYEKNNNIETCKYKVMPAVWRCLYKKSAIGNIRFNKNIRFAEDLLFDTQLLLKDIKLGYLDKYLYNYCLNDTSISSRCEKQIVANMKSYIDIIPFFENVLFDSKYSIYLSAIKFNSYFSYYIANLRCNTKFSLEKVKKLKTRKNFKARMRLTKDWKQKIKYFLVYYNFKFILRFLLRLYNKNNKKG